MSRSLGTLWKKATDAFREKHDYLVYAPRDGKFEGFKLHQDYSDAAIHRALAHRENNHPSRQSVGIIQPGSFNFIRVESCLDIRDAVRKAQEDGLKWEPIKTVLARRVNAERERAAQKPTPAEMQEFEKLMEMVDRLSGKGARPPRP